MKVKAKKRTFLFVEVLQNGSPVAAHFYPVGRRCNVKISAKSKGLLSIPLYPLADDVAIFRTTKKGARILLNSAWDGFVSRHGEFITINFDNYDSYTYELSDGDFGCINLKDLKILFRIGDQRLASKHRYDRQYSSSISSVVFEERRDISYFFAAMGVTALIFGLALSALFMKRDSTPNKLVDLKKEYLLPLIHPDHLKTLPEAMQSSLDRSIPLISAINYYSAVVSMLLNYEPNPFPNMLFSTSLNFYRKLHKANLKALAELGTQQEERQQHVLRKENQGLLAMPAVVGETFDGSLLRLEDKISLLHKNFDKNLELKKDYKDRIKKAQKREAEYNYEDYRNLNTAASSGSEILAKIRVLDKDTNEEAMYVQVNGLGKEAAFVQNNIRDFSDEKVPLSRSSASPIGVAIGEQNVCYLPPQNFDDFNHKFAMIIAGEFSPSRPEKVREPLVGEINKDLIDKVVRANRFDLQLCYELALRRNQGLSGGMDIKWRLDSRGEVSELEINATSIHDRQMEKCLLRKLASWKFPRPNHGSVEINHHLSFSPARG